MHRAVFSGPFGDFPVLVPPEAAQEKQALFGGSVKKISSIEVSPVRFTTSGGEKYAEVTTPRKASAWGVYLRLASGTAEWVSDHRTKTRAIAVARKLANKHGVQAWAKK
jgi:hypothetical protein